MGIILKKQTSYGVEANYWKIGKIFTEEIEGSRINIITTINPYVSKEALSPLERDLKTYVIEGDKTFNGNIYQYLYSEIMKKPEFEGGVSDEDE